MHQSKLVVATVAVVLVVGGGVYAGMYVLAGSLGASCTKPGGSIQVVAGENFWGSLISQLGGTRVNVTSVVTDPNTDPHTYEGNTANARAVSNACLVTVNGANYDVWLLNIIAAAGAQQQTVLNVQEVLGQPTYANPHFWYSPTFVNLTVKAMYSDLVKIDPGNTGYYRKQYASLNSSLWTSYMHEEQMIKKQFGGLPVAATEDIFVYMANATGLKVISPPNFMKAVSEGNDPSPQDIATFQNQLNGGNATVRALAYNIQTVTPLTQNLLALAAKNEIPIARISETIQPSSLTFQAWMQGEIAQLENALNAGALGK